MKRVTELLRNVNPIAAVGALVLLAGTGVVAMVLFIFGLLTHSGAYQVSVSRIEESREVRALSGGIVGYGRFPQGSIQTVGDEGHADLRIRVKGRDRDVTVHTVVEKHSGEPWSVASFQVLR
jgi:hypothetical protein